MSGSYAQGSKYYRFLGVSKDYMLNKYYKSEKS